VADQDHAVALGERRSVRERHRAHRARVPTGLLQHHRAELRRMLARPRADEPDPVRVAETVGGRGRERLGEDGLELLGLGPDLSFERRGVGQR
jgi:hypothetical protein